MEFKDKYLTISQAAKELNVTRQTIHRWLVRGGIQTERVGRETLISKKELRRYLADQSIIQTQTQIVNDIINRVRGKYNYNAEDTVEFLDFPQKKTLLFYVTRKSGGEEMVYVDVGRAEPIESADEKILTYGYKIPIKNIYRRDM